MDQTTYNKVQVLDQIAAPIRKVIRVSGMDKIDLFLT